MKKTLFVLIMMLCCIGVNAQRVAVLDFNAGVGVSQGDVDGISAIFNTYFSPKGYTLVERTQIDKAIDEQNFQRGKFTESQMVRIGQILNVSNVVVGDINIVAGQYNVDVRVINVQSGTIQAAEGATWTSGTSYRNMMKGIAEKLANKIAINPVAPSAPGGGSNSSSTSRKRTSVETIYGYLKVFPEEIGNFESEPNTVINQLNSQAVHGYNTWRVPTNEELSLLRANGYLSNSKYMTKESPNGQVLLVTDKADATTIASAKKEINGREYVDLGLPSGLKWATCNYGASSSSEYGDYWTYKDAFNAVKQWGGTWRLPTKSEFQELINNCIWRWTSQNGEKGYKVTGPNGNSIFLPAAGYFNDYGYLDRVGSYGRYWSSTLLEYDSDRAYNLLIDSSDHFMSEEYYDNRSRLRSVRPVTE